MASSVFLGLDLGTSGVKAILVDERGDVVASATTPLTMDTPRPGWAEQDPEAWWTGTHEHYAVPYARFQSLSPALRSAGV